MIKLTAVEGEDSTCFAAAAAIDTAVEGVDSTCDAAVEAIETAVDGS